LIYNIHVAASWTLLPRAAAPIATPQLHRWSENCIPSNAFQDIIHHLSCHRSYSPRDTDSAKNIPQNISQLIFSPVTMRLVNYEFERKGADIAVASQFEVLCWTLPGIMYQFI